MRCIVFFLLLISSIVHGQQGYWQQQVDYTMDIDFEVDKHQYTGVQELIYTNHSPDTLHRVFYHLYFNAFQPFSMMDVRSRTIVDPDPRVMDRIVKLSEDQIGYQRVRSLTQDGRAVHFQEAGTILEVDLDRAILPGESTVLNMTFEAQVPVQIRRSGRNSKEGIDYSMAQWYPKLCEYDEQGWHANPYIGREFHGVWGDFDVTIHIDKDYVLGGTGILANADEVGHGYGSDKARPIVQDDGKVRWHFEAKNVIDFAWAADRDYTVLKHDGADGTRFYFLYQPGEKTNDNWQRLPAIVDAMANFTNDRYGKYLYPVYSVAQGGDGGMEYPMITLITGERPFPSLVGVTVHEWMHCWYQSILATNESLYAWMDEGFVSFATAETMEHLREIGLLTDRPPAENPFLSTYQSYTKFAASGNEEALSTHADHFNTNQAYIIGSYAKGSVFLKQLEYIIGQKPFQKGMKRYYHEWKFKHPDVDDFIRVMEKVSGLELDWYKEYWVSTTKTIDYAVADVLSDADKAYIYLERVGDMPMPLDVVVVYDDLSREMIHIPLRIMRGAKSAESTQMPFLLAADWNWTHPFYELTLDTKGRQIKYILIDPSARLADIDVSNNRWPQTEADDEGEGSPEEGN